MKNADDDNDHTHELQSEMKNYRKRTFSHLTSPPPNKTIENHYQQIISGEFVAASSLYTRRTEWQELNSGGMYFFWDLTAIQ